MHSISGRDHVDKKNSRQMIWLVNGAQITVLFVTAVVVLAIGFSLLPAIQQQKMSQFFHGASASSVIARPIWKRGRIGFKELEMEVAVTDETRQQGLMFRTQLSPNHGMVFVYPAPRLIEIWMKNTLIPLDVAFLNYQGVIMNIETMEPLTLTHHASKGYAMYALEMGAGWFAKNKIRPGMRVEGVPDYRYAEP